MLARVVVDEARRRGLRIPDVDEARVVPGRGVECIVHGRTVRAGSAAFLSDAQIRPSEALLEDADRIGATAILVADGNRLAGAILLRDRIRAGAREAVAELDAMDITYQVMLTGDRRRAAEAIAREVAIPNVEAELLPEQKLERIRQLISQGRFVAMAGEGINDAPALAAAQVGVAVAGASDITAEAADVVYLGHSLEKLPKLFAVSRRAVTTAWQNIILFAGLFNLLAVTLAAGGILGPLAAAFTHQLSSFFVMMNSLRLLRVERAERSWAARLLDKSRLPLVWAWIGRWVQEIDVRDGFEHLVEHRREYAKPALYTVLALIVLSGFYTLNPDEQGVIERFGRKILPYKEPGLHYKLPWPVERLTRIQARRIRVVEIGFRSNSTTPDNEPAAYEWNVQHRSGRFQRKPEEALVLAGDQNMLEVNCVVHYRIKQPDSFLFRQIDGDATVRTASESVLQSVITTSSLDDALTVGRRAIEGRIQKGLQDRLDRYDTGVEVLHVKLLDVHPSLEVVDAFRDVSGAFEEKNRMINEAEGYHNEQIALARGNGKAQILNAEGYSIDRENRAGGDATRFDLREEAYRANPGLTDLRLYLETMEQILPGKRKMIIDSSKGRRQLLLLDDGVELSPSAAPLVAPQPQPTRFRNPDED